jgi:hypothetical protein
MLAASAAAKAATVGEAHRPCEVSQQLRRRRVQLPATAASRASRLLLLLVLVLMLSRRVREQLRNRRVKRSRTRRLAATARARGSRLQQCGEFGGVPCLLCLLLRLLCQVGAVRSAQHAQHAALPQLAGQRQNAGDIRAGLQGICRVAATVRSGVRGQQGGIAGHSTYQHDAEQRHTQTTSVLHDTHTHTCSTGSRPW